MYDWKDRNNNLRFKKPEEVDGIIQNSTPQWSTVDCMVCDTVIEARKETCVTAIIKR